MTQRTEDVTTQEVLERIDILERKLARFGDYLYQLSQISIDREAANADKFESAFERIKHVEVTVFPNLLKDLSRIHQIVGGSGIAADHPLDKRKISPRKVGPAGSE